MERKIIKIDQELCNGCTLCASACHEGAIGMVDGKAVLLRDDYCDGLGDCLPVCPTNAISFEVREALAYDEEAVKKNMEKAHHEEHECGCSDENEEVLGCGCPGTENKTIIRKEESTVEVQHEMESRLSQWPVQIMLANPNSAYFKDSRLLIAADCTAFAYANFHEKFIKNHITLIGCPKQDDYTSKLTAIIEANNIKSINVVRMEVPCCGGLTNAVVNALKNTGKLIPWSIVTISTDGKIIED